MKKYNLLLNSNFKTLDFNDKIDDSIYAPSNNNLLKYSVILTLDTKPDSNTTKTDVNLNDKITCYLFPIINNNISFNTGDILQLHDNIGVFIITSHISSNKFELKLIATDSSNKYSLYNTSLALLYNKTFEEFIHINNDLAKEISKQKSEYTEYLNNNNDFVEYFFNKIKLTDDSTVGFEFDFKSYDDNKIFNTIINKFYLNVWIYDYNDFKYIYQKDIQCGDIHKNKTLVSNNHIIGILNSLQTKILPHYSTKLLINNTYTFNTKIVNKHTKYNKNFNNNKLIFIFQLSLKDKSNIYDQDDNIESDYMYLIM
jgi:hypothetical protein